MREEILLSKKQKKWLTEILESGLLDKFSRTGEWPDFTESIDEAQLIKDNNVWLTDIQEEISDVIKEGLYYEGGAQKQLQAVVIYYKLVKNKN